MFDADKTRIIGLLCGEKKLWQHVKPFSSNPGTSRTDRFAISILRVSVLTRDKNWKHAIRHMTLYSNNVPDGRLVNYTAQIKLKIQEENLLKSLS